MGSSNSTCTSFRPWLVQGKERGKGRKREKELTLIGSVREHWPQAIVRKGWSDISAGAVPLSLFLSLGSSSWSEGSVKCSYGKSNCESIYTPLRYSKLEFVFNLAVLPCSPEYP